MTFLDQNLMQQLGLQAKNRVAPGQFLENYEPAFGDGREERHLEWFEREIGKLAIARVKRERRRARIGIILRTIRELFIGD